jgi:hypothetical protein
MYYYWKLDAYLNSRLTHKCGIACARSTRLSRVAEKLPPVQGEISNFVGCEVATAVFVKRVLSSG